MADRLKLAQGLRTLPASARQDLAQRAEDLERGKTVELLRRAGKEMYDNPIVNTAIGFTPVLGDVQAAGETMAAFNRGAPWQETAGYVAGMLPFIPMIGKTVWHGSPHTFDKFDLSKIGTGEGAQAYGHGLYFAEAPGVAADYQKKLTIGDNYVNGELLDVYNPKHNLALVLQQESGNLDNAKDTLNFLATRGGSKSIKDTARESLNLLEKGEMPSVEFIKPEGALYKVDLPDEQIAKMLDWDNPITEEMRQPISQAMMEKFGSGLSMGSGEQAYKQIVDEFKFAGSQDPKGDATKWMLEQDVPGIQYLDQASRGTGDGTRNYVVFSDEIPQILERNGTPLGNAVREYNPTEMPISDLKLNEYGEAIAKSNIGRDKNFVSKNQNPISVVRLPSGEPYVLDGYHRLEFAKRAGQENIQVNDLPLTVDIKKMLINVKIIGQE